MAAEEKKQSYTDNTDRIEVERDSVQSGEALLWTWTSAYKAGYDHAQFHCAIHHCNQCQPPDRYYFALCGGIDLFKVQMGRKTCLKIRCQSYVFALGFNEQTLIKIKGE